MSKKGNDCYLVYLVQRSDVTKFSIAKDIDQEYYKNSLIAKKNGVNFFAYKCEVTKKGINVVGKLEINEN
jgi:sugar fermentation stimulation protein A